MICNHSINGQLLKTSVLTECLCCGVLWNFCLSLNRYSWAVESKLFLWISLLDENIFGIQLHLHHLSRGYSFNNMHLECITSVGWLIPYSTVWTRCCKGLPVTLLGACLPSFSVQLSLLLSITEEMFNSCFIYVHFIWSHRAHCLNPLRNFISVACMWLLSFFLRTNDSLPETSHYETQVYKRSAFYYTVLFSVFSCSSKHLSYIAVFISFITV